MKAEYDFSTMKSRRNPYAAKLNRQVTIRMSDDIISYFKEMADETGELGGNIIVITKHNIGTVKAQAYKCDDR